MLLADLAFVGFIHSIGRRSTSTVISSHCCISLGMKRSWSKNHDVKTVPYHFDTVVSNNEAFDQLG